MFSQSDNKKRKRVILLDTHAILHRAYHALPGFTSNSGEPTGALYGLCTMLLSIVNELKPNYLIAAYDLPEPTYRHEVYEDYKAGRAETEDDLALQIKNSKEILSAFNIPIYEKVGFEADDVLATIVEELKEREDIEIIIASGDMDTLQLVEGDKVRVYTLKKGLKDTVIYNEKQIKERFGFSPELLPDFKGLCGDASDNIPGVSGIGEKSAKKLIQDIGGIDKIFKKIKKDTASLEKAGITKRVINALEGNEEEAEFSKMLGTVRRDVPLDFSLPDNKWIEAIKIDEVEKVFDKFQFRSLYPRLENTLGEEKWRERREDDVSESEIEETELQETAVALWVLDSTVTTPVLDDILRFAGTESLKKAKEFIFKKLKEENLLDLYEKVEKPLIPIVKAMSEKGVRIDKKYLEELSSKYHEELAGIEKKVWEYAGEEFNINSPQQLGNILFDKLELKIKNHKKTSTGKLSTKESELEKMKETHPIIESILEYRELQKLLSTYIDNIPSMLDEDNLLHAEFLQTGTTTGRMSSRNPNLQNIPIRTEKGRNIRKAFVANPGFKLFSLDYSQIELRVAAFLSGDRKLINIFKNGGDPHTAVASEVFNVSPEDVTKEMRRSAKVINFGILYGMGVNSLKQNLSVERSEAQSYLNEYFNKFEGLANYISSTKEKARRDGYTETYFGRRRYIEGINSSIQYISSGAERMAVNAPIQGTSADIIKFAMIEADNFLKNKNFNKDAFLLLQVHDELVYEIKEEKKEEISKEIKNIMESIIHKKDTGGIIFEVDVEEGEDWGRIH